MALIANEGSFIEMEAKMRFKISFFVKRLKAYLTNEGSNSCVSSFMHN